LGIDIGRPLSTSFQDIVFKEAIGGLLGALIKGSGNLIVYPSVADRAFPIVPFLDHKGLTFGTTDFSHFLFSYLVVKSIEVSLVFNLLYHARRKNVC